MFCVVGSPSQKNYFGGNYGIGNFAGSNFDGSIRSVHKFKLHLLHNHELQLKLTSTQPPLRILTFPPSPRMERGGVRQGERFRRHGEGGLTLGRETKR